MTNPEGTSTRRISARKRSGSQRCSIVSKETTQSNVPSGKGMAHTSPSTKVRPAAVYLRFACSTAPVQMSSPVTSHAEAARMSEPYPSPEAASRTFLPRHSAAAAR